MCFECPDCSFLLKLRKTCLPGARSPDPPLNRAQAQRASRVPLTPRLGPSPVYVASLAPLVLEFSAPALCGPSAACAGGMPPERGWQTARGSALLLDCGRLLALSEPHLATCPDWGSGSDSFELYKLRLGPKAQT